MQFWQCPLLLMVSLIAAINTQQTPSQRLEPNQVAGLVELQQQQVQPIQGQQQQEQPSQSDNKDYQHPPSAALLLQMSPSDWKHAEDKRSSWNRMQGMWGKRSSSSGRDPSDEPFPAVVFETTSQRLAKRAWSDLTHQGWGKRSWNQLHGAWGKRRWDQLHGAWGKRTLLDGQDDQEDDDQSSMERQDSETDMLDMSNNKRSGWNKMQGVWGKRSAPPVLALTDNNDLLVMVEDDDQLYQRDEEQPSDRLNAKGYKLVQDDQNDEVVNKRAWNQMQGAWGKRALSAMAAGYKRNWNNLRGAWGKREMPVAVAKGVEWSRKRESGWNNLKGLWG